MVSERAKRLVEALHELWTNEARWLVVQAFLDEERDAATSSIASAAASQTAIRSDGDGGTSSISHRDEGL